MPHIIPVYKCLGCGKLIEGEGVAVSEGENTIQPREYDFVLDKTSIPRAVLHDNCGAYPGIRSLAEILGFVRREAIEGAVSLVPVTQED